VKQASRDPSRQQQQQIVVKQEPGAHKAAGHASAAAAGCGPGSSSRRVLEVCVEPPGGGEWAVTHLQLSQVRDDCWLLGWSVNQRA
jgi:hypothetical protein